MEANGAPTNNSNPGEGVKVEIPKVGAELSKVATNPKQGIAIFIVGILVAAYLVWGIFSEEETDKKKDKKTEKVEKPKIVSKPSADIEVSQETAVPGLPKAPELKDPTAPPPSIPAQPVPVAPILPPKEIKQDVKDVPKPPLPQVLPPVVAKPAPAPLVARPLPAPSIPIPNGEDSGTKVSKGVIPKAVVDPEKKKEKMSRQKSAIMLVGGAPAKSEEKVEQETLFKKKSKLEYVLGKGKVLDAVVETAINTDMPSEVRAVISRDVYSESGKIILIPKGTRIFGNFSSGVDGTYGRVNINWDRIDLPSGYIITLQGIGVDNLGRKGSEGRLDTKIKEKITNSVLSTAVNVAFAGALDQIIKPETKVAQANKGQAVATNLQQAIQGVMNDPSIPDAQKINAICIAATNAVQDPSDPSYGQIQAACNNARTSPGANTQQTIQTLYNSLMASANSSIAQTAAASTPTKQQEATKKGMEDFTKTIEDIVKQAQPKPTVTIDQGTHIKIYVNRDYNFPREAVSSSRVIQ